MVTGKNGGWCHMAGMATESFILAIDQVYPPLWESDPLFLESEQSESSSLGIYYQIDERQAPIAKMEDPLAICMEGP